MSNCSQPVVPTIPQMLQHVCVERVTYVEKVAICEPAVDCESRMPLSFLSLPCLCRGREMQVFSGVHADACCEMPLASSMIPDSSYRFPVSKAVWREQQIDRDGIFGIWLASVLKE